MSEVGERAVPRWAQVLVALVGSVTALAVRVPLRNFASSDYLLYTRDWYLTIRSQGADAFSHGFSDYTPSYLYCLYGLSKLFPDLPAMAATKAPASVADFVCAALVAWIVQRVRGCQSWSPPIAFVLVLLAPTVVVNSAQWGQSDSLFTAGLLGCLALLVAGRPGAAWVAVGIAFAFKLQSVFLAPFLLALLVRGVGRWWHVLLVPLVYVLSILPSWVAGRPLGELLLVYVSQADQMHELTRDAPNLYAWIPAGLEPVVFPIGILLGIGTALTFVFVVARSRAPLTASHLVQLALVSLVLVPFTLPRMHERYFFPADVVSIAYAFCFPRRAWVPVAVGGLSFLAYHRFLYGEALVPLSVLAVGMLAVVVVLVRDLLASLGHDAPSGEPR